jgi:PAS domain S-box-containing protein
MPNDSPSRKRARDTACAGDRDMSNLEADAPTERSLRSSQARLAGILDIADDAIILVDNQQRITLFNQGAEKIFGYTAPEVLGQPIGLLLPRRFERIHQQHLIEFAGSAGTARRMGEQRDIYGRRKDGTEFPAEASISKLDLDGEATFTVILRDISARKRAEDRQAIQFAVTRIIAESENRYDAIPALLRTICRSIAWDLGEFWRVNTDTNLLCWENDWRASGFDGSAFVTTSPVEPFACGVGLLGRVWASRQPEWFATIDIHSSPRVALALAAGFHAAFAFPILGGGTVFGVMVYFCHEAQPSDPDLLITMADIGSQIGQFFERAGAEERLWQYTQRLKTLHIIDQAILAAQSPEAIAQAALRHMRELVPCMTATVSAFDFTAQEAIVLAVESSAAMPTRRGTHVPLDVFPSLPALQQGQSFTLDDLQDSSTPTWLYQQALKAGVRSYMSVPIILQHNLLGVLTLLSDQPRAFALEYIDIVREVCDQLAVALQNARLFEQVRAGAESVRRMSQQLLRAQEDERRLIARELHDEVGQSLTAALLNLQALVHLPDPIELPARLEDSMAQIERVLQQIRTLSLNLRPALLDDLGLVPALRWLVSRQAERAGFDAKFNVDLMDERFAADIETTCFRAVQEAITNIARYAQAQCVTIELLKRGTELCVSIRDDGVGFEVAAALQRAAQGHSMGLLSMQERVLLLGGQMRIESAPGQGTMIEMSLPLVLPAAEVPATTSSSLP